MSRWQRDVFVPNESDGFVFAAGSLRGSGVSPGDAGWERALAARSLLPLVVESEDPASVRVVVGGDLTAEERDQWVGRVDGGLDLAGAAASGGQLALCGGLAWVLDAGDWAEEYARVLEVPAGRYRASLYCYASAPNGRACLEAAGSDEALGAWFRREHPGREFPGWLHDACVADPELDPGHEKQWRRAKERGGPRVIDFLLHLEPIDEMPPPVAVADHGFAEAQGRRPAVFPLGLPAEALEGAPDSGREDASEAPPAPAPAPASPADLAPLARGPLSLPVEKLARAARVAWFCHPYTRPTLTATFSAKPPRIEVDGATARAEGRSLRVSFDDDGQPAGAADALRAVGRELAKASGLVRLDLELARSSPAQAVGRHRYAGAVEAGAWRVEAAFPAVPAATLAEALALAEALENGRRFTARDEEEATRIEARVARSLADYFGSNALQRTGAELALARRDPALFGHVLARAFWMRYSGTWPLQDDDAD